MQMLNDVRTHSSSAIIKIVPFYVCPFYHNFIIIIVLQLKVSPGAIHAVIALSWRAISIEQKLLIKSVMFTDKTLSLKHEKYTK